MNNTEQEETCSNSTDLPSESVSPTRTPSPVKTRTSSPNKPMPTLVTSRKATKTTMLSSHLVPDRNTSVIENSRQASELLKFAKAPDRSISIISQDFSSVHRKSTFHDAMHSRRASSFTRKIPIIKGNLGIASMAAGDPKKISEEIIKNKTSDSMLQQDRNRLLIAFMASDKLASGPFRNYLVSTHNDTALEFVELWEWIEMLRCLTSEGGRRGATAKAFGGNGFLSCHDEWPVLKDDPYFQYGETLRQMKKHPESISNFLNKFNELKSFVAENPLNKPLCPRVLQEKIDKLNVAGCDDEILALVQVHVITKLKKNIDSYSKFDSNNFFHYLSQGSGEEVRRSQSFTKMDFMVERSQRRFRKYQTAADLHKDLIYSPMANRLWVAVDICEKEKEEKKLTPTPIGILVNIFFSILHKRSSEMFKIAFKKCLKISEIFGPGARMASHRKKTWLDRPKKDDDLTNSRRMSTVTNNFANSLSNRRFSSLNLPSSIACYTSAKNLRTVEGIQKLMRHAGNSPDGSMIQLWLDLQWLRHTTKDNGHLEMMLSIRDRYTATSSVLPNEFKTQLQAAVDQIGSISLNTCLITRREDLWKSYDILLDNPFVQQKPKLSMRERNPLLILQNDVIKSLKTDFCKRFLLYYDCLPNYFRYTASPGPELNPSQCPLTSGRSKSTLPSIDQTSDKMEEDGDKKRPKTCYPHLHPKVRAFSGISRKTSGYVSLTPDEKLADYSSTVPEDEAVKIKRWKSLEFLSEKCETVEEKKRKSMPDLSIIDITVNEPGYFNKSLAHCYLFPTRTPSPVKTRTSSPNKPMPTLVTSRKVTKTTMLSSHLVPDRNTSVIENSRQASELLKFAKAPDRSISIISQDFSSVHRKSTFHDAMHSRRASSFTRKIPIIKGNLGIASMAAGDPKKISEEIIKNKTSDSMLQQDRNRLLIAFMASDKLASGPFRNYLVSTHNDTALEFVELWEWIEMLRCLTSEGGRRGATAKAFGGNGFLSCHDEWPVLKDDPYFQYGETLRQMKKHPESISNFLNKFNELKSFVADNPLKKPLCPRVLQEKIDKLNAAGCDDEILALVQVHVITKLKKNIDSYSKFDSNNFFHYLSQGSGEEVRRSQSFTKMDFMVERSQRRFRKYQTAADLHKDLIYSPMANRLWVAVDIYKLASGPFRNYLVSTHNDTALEFVELWEWIEMLRCLTSEGGRRGATAKAFGGNGFLSCHDEWPVLKDDPYFQYGETLRQMKKHPESISNFLNKFNELKSFVADNPLKKPLCPRVLQEKIDKLNAAGCDDEILALVQVHVITKLKKNIDSYSKFDSNNFFHYLSQGSGEEVRRSQSFTKMDFMVERSQRRFRKYQTAADLHKDLIYSPMANRLWVAVDICEKLIFPFALRKLSMPMLTLGTMIKLKMFLVRRRKEKDAREKLKLKAKTPLPAVVKLTVAPVKKKKIAKPKKFVFRRKIKDDENTHYFAIDWKDKVESHEMDLDAYISQLKESITEKFEDLVPLTIEDFLRQDSTAKHFRRYILRNHKNSAIGKDQLINIITFLSQEFEVESKIDTPDFPELSRSLCSTYVFGKSSILHEFPLPENVVKMIVRKRSGNPTFLLHITAVVKHWVYTNLWDDFITKMYQGKALQAEQMSFVKEYDQLTKYRPVFSKALAKSLMHFVVRSQSLISFLSKPNQFEEFRRFLVDQGTQLDKNGLPVDRLLFGKRHQRLSVYVSKLPQDLYFLVEVLAYRDLLLHARTVARDMTLTGSEEIAVLDKVDTIVELFLDSSIAPKLQVNLPTPVAADLMISFKSLHCGFNVLSEALGNTLQILLLFWKQFCFKKFVPESQKKEQVMARLRGKPVSSSNVPQLSNRLKSVVGITITTSTCSRFSGVPKSNCDNEIGGVNFSITRGVQDIYRPKALYFNGGIQGSARFRSTMSCTSQRSGSQRSGSQRSQRRVSSPKKRDRLMVNNAHKGNTLMLPTLLE
eukprot:sb/3460594/